MTVSTQILESAEFVGDGVISELPFNFYFDDDSDVMLYEKDSEGTWAVSARTFSVNRDSANSESGSLTLSAPLGSGKIVKVVRDTSKDQLEEIHTHSKFLPEMIEKGYDKLTCMVQELCARSIKLPKGSNINTNFPIPLKPGFVLTNDGVRMLWEENVGNPDDLTNVQIKTAFQSNDYVMGAVDFADKATLDAYGAPSGFQTARTVNDGRLYEYLDLTSGWVLRDRYLIDDRGNFTANPKFNHIASDSSASSVLGGSSSQGIFIGHEHKMGVIECDGTTDTFSINAGFPILDTNTSSIRAFLIRDSDNLWVGQAPTVTGYGTNIATLELTSTPSDGDKLVYSIIGEEEVLGLNTITSSASGYDHVINEIADTFHGRHDRGEGGGHNTSPGGSYGWFQNSVYCTKRGGRNVYFKDCQDASADGAMIFLDNCDTSDASGQGIVAINCIRSQIKGYNITAINSRGIQINGEDHYAENAEGSVLSGRGHIANERNCVIEGAYGQSYNAGEIIESWGKVLADRGLKQRSTIHMNHQTTDGTEATANKIYGGNQISFNHTEARNLKVGGVISATNLDGSKVSSWNIDFLVRLNNGAATRTYNNTYEKLDNTPPPSAEIGNWSIRVQIAGQKILLRLTGEDGETIDWDGYLEVFAR